MPEQVTEKLEAFGMENSAYPDGLQAWSFMCRVVSDLGESVAEVCELSLETQGSTGGWCCIEHCLSVIMLVAPWCLSSELPNKLCRHSTSALRGDVKPLLESEILESCDKVNVWRLHSRLEQNKGIPIVLFPWICCMVYFVLLLKPISV